MTMYGPAAYEEFKERQRRQRLRKRARKRAARLLREEDILIDTERLLAEIERDRLGDGYSLLDDNDRDDSPMEPDPDRLFR